MRAIVWSRSLPTSRPFGHFQDQLAAGTPVCAAPRAPEATKSGWRNCSGLTLTDSGSGWPAASSAARPGRPGAGPAAQRHDQAARFGHRDEHVRRHEAAVGALPAHQQFGAGRACRRHRPAAAGASPARRARWRRARSRSSVRRCSASARMAVRTGPRRCGPRPWRGTSRCRLRAAGRRRALAGCGMRATPMLAEVCRVAVDVDGSRGRAQLVGHGARAAALRRCGFIAVQAGSSTTNSSPPMRATVSCSRISAGSGAAPHCAAARRRSRGRAHR
jgi:hypothetical protein